MLHCYREQSELSSYNISQQNPGAYASGYLIVMAREFAKSFYKSRVWEDVRQYCLMRDSYLCRKCGRPAVDVHHIIHLSPDNIMDKSIALNPDNLISLCKDCHFNEHRGEHGNGRKNSESYLYEFDENGQLVKKKFEIPPSS